VRCSLDPFLYLSERRRHVLIVVPHLSLNQGGVAADDRQKIIEVVSHAPGKPPECFHSQRFPGLLFRTACLRLVLKDFDEALQPATLIPHRLSHPVG